jgi:hypothetical protein
VRRERKQRRGRPEGAKGLIDAVLAKYGVVAAVREHRLVTSWSDIVGTKNAAQCWPDGLKKGLLYVRVVNSTWMQQLSFFREEIVRKANRIVGDPPLVKELRLHLGARRDAPDEDDLVALLAEATRRRRLPARGPVARAAPREIDHEVSKIADEDLREIVRAVRKKIGL